MTEDISISVRGLRFSYDGPGRPVLAGLSLDIPEAAVTAILGPNGSGKTTLLRVLLGMLTPQGGRILVRGRLQGEYSRRAMSRTMGLVPQREHFPLGFSVLEYVLLGRAPHLGLLDRPGGGDAQAAMDAVTMVGMADLAGRLVPTLSGGERQLATVARALAQGPEIMLMDEPTSHLDLGNKQRILEVVRALSDERVTVALTTHNPSDAAAVADHIVLISAGQVVASGRADDVLTSENLSKTYGLPVEVTRVHGRLVVLT
jgi:iron complex transport system ATP-binding protein